MITQIPPFHFWRTLVRAAKALVSLAAPAAVPAAAAEIPDTLQYAIPAPPVGTQTNPQIGKSVAMDGPYTVVGTPYDGTGGANSGAVKVFDSASGALRFLLLNPGPEQGDHFGWSVAISGTRVVVGAYGDNTGQLDAGSAYVYDLASGSPTVPVLTLNDPRQGSDDLFGYSVAISGDRIVVAAPTDDTNAIDSGRVYVFEQSSATPSVPVVVLNNPRGGAGDQFGYSVAISATRMVVGANLSDAGAIDSGNVYLYDLSNGSSSPGARRIDNPSRELSDEFGNAVAISGSQVVVAAFKDGTGAIDAGSVYVYDFDTGSSGPVATLHNPGPALSDYFGYSLAISGSRVLVGTVNDSTAGSLAGSAYVYDLNGATPAVPVVTLDNPHWPASDLFGWSVAITGTHLVVGGRLSDPGATGAGGAYVYDINSGTPTAPLTALRSPTPTAGDNFGIHVAVSGTRMVVGADGSDTGATNAGSASVYDLSSGTPTVPLFTLNNPAPEVNDRFGYSVAISGNWVVIGSHLEDTGASDAGTVYVFDLSSNSPTIPLYTLNNPGPEVNDRFGCSVAISGTRVVVGAYLDDTGAFDTGSVYVYDLGSGSPAVPQFMLTNPSPAAEDWFGWSVAISGTRIVVGTPVDRKNEVGFHHVGSASVYDLSGGTPTVPLATLNNPAAVPGPSEGISPGDEMNFFGYSVAISGTRIAVGVPFNNTLHVDAGRAHVYDLSSGTPAVPVATLNNPEPAAMDSFGNSVTIDGTRLVVGARGDDSGAGDAGSAYVYDLSSATPTAPVATLTNPSPAAGDQFGYSVAIDGMSVVIGAPNDDSVAADKGFAYVFAPYPDIAVEQPVGTALADRFSSVAFGEVLMGSSSAAVTLTVRNTGTASLELGQISLNGESAGEFTLSTAGMLASLPAGASTTFNVIFTPAALGRRIAALHIPSNVTGPKNPYDLALTGTGFDPASPGSPDTLDVGFGGFNLVLATVVQPDGKIIIAGNFSTVQGEPRQNIARLHADGTLDMGFDPKPDYTVYSVAVQSDGNVLLGGQFTTLQPNGAATATARRYIARVNADGTLDTVFDPSANSVVYSVAEQADGKVLLGGAFTTLQPNGAAAATARQYIAQVNADGTLDTVFDPRANSVVYSVAEQADGKVLLGGYFTTLQPNSAATTTARRYIARVNADGTLDTVFDPSANNVVFSVAEQADGKVLLGGYFTTLQPNSAAAATARRYIARVNTDGMVDTGFDPKPNSIVYSVALQADGKVLLGGDFTTLQPNSAATATARRYIARVNADGALDNGFDPGANSRVHSVAVQANGRVLLGGQFTTFQPNSTATAITRAGFARLLNDSAPQTLSAPDSTQLVWARGGAGPELSRATFEQSADGGVNWTLLGAGTRIGTTPNWQLTGLSLPAGGQLRASGVTTGGYYNGSSGLVESGTSFGIVPAPTVTGISPPVGTTAGGTRVTIAGTDFTGASLVTIGGSPASDLMVVNATTITATTPAHGAGTADVSVTTPSGPGTGMALFTYSGAPGNLDALDATIRGINSTVYATAVQPDGKLIFAGSFASVLGVPRQNLARLNADGTLDMGFDPKPNSAVLSVAVQADGKVLLSGQFTTLQPNSAAAATARGYIARVNADGTLDADFDPRSNSTVNSLAVQADGKVLLGGGFSTLQPNGTATATTRQRIARVNADGTLDNGFDPRANNFVFSVALQADGKVLLGGFFTTLQPNGAAAATARSRIARVNADGTLDAGFDPRANSSVFSVALQADGKVLLGGQFSTLQPNGAATTTVRRRIARVNADGTLDTGFDPKANDSILSMALQADGKVLLGGRFTTLQPNGAAAATVRQRVARLNADGTLDASFDPKPNGQVNSVALQADGRVLLGGTFTAFQPSNAGSRNYFARLLNDPATQTLVTPHVTQAVWQRGGTAPELNRVTFDLSTDGGVTWTPLGPGTRVGKTPSWRMLGLQLPAAGQLRARGGTSGGSYNGSSGLIEQVVVLSYPPASDNDGLLDSWELAYWPTTAGHGPHDDDDRDGYDNLLELAFNLDPTRPDTGGLPGFTLEGGYVTMTIIKQPGVTYEGQSADTSQPDAFSAAGTMVLINDATTLKVRDNVPTTTGPRRFMRAVVTGEP